MTNKLWRTIHIDGWIEETISGTGVSKKITFGARNKAKLSAAQLASVTDKGWVLG